MLTISDFSSATLKAQTHSRLIKPAQCKMSLPHMQPQITHAMTDNQRQRGRALYRL